MKMAMAKVNAAAILPVVDRLISAYETSQRIALEREELECRHDLAVKAIALKERELELNHARWMKALDQFGKALDRHLAVMERHAAQFEADQAELREAARMIMNALCTSSGDNAFRREMLGCWKDIQDRLADGLEAASVRLDRELAACSRQLSAIAPKRLSCQPGKALGMRAGNMIEVEAEEV